MDTRALLAVVLVASIFALAACAAKRPVLYPNPHLRYVGIERAEMDIDECMHLAAVGVGNRSAASKTAKSTAIGAGAGAAVGAAGGAVVGRAGTGAAVGAATGGTSGMLRGILRGNEPDPIYKRFVNRCLRERGYEPIGWR